MGRSRAASAPSTPPPPHLSNYLSLLPIFTLLIVLIIIYFSRRKSPPPKLPPPSEDEPAEEHETFDEPTEDGLAAGTRVEIHGLQKAPALNGTHGVVLRFDAASSRFVVRKEIAAANEAPTVTVRSSNLRPARRPYASPAALQELLDKAPVGARVTLARGAVEDEPAAAADDSSSSSSSGSSSSKPTASTKQPTLVIRKAITLSGMGGKTGGTLLKCNVEVDDAIGECVELSGLHIHGTVDLAPRDVTRVRLSRVHVTAPPSHTTPALFLDEIGRKIPDREAASLANRVLLEDCWVRGGSVGVHINAVGVVLRRCRIQNAESFGVHANASFAIEACTIGMCAKSGRGGGIVARAGCQQIRGSNGVNENRVQRDANDKGYSGYSGDCRGCVGRCTCSAMFLLMGMGDSPVKWDGAWRKI